MSELKLLLTDDVAYISQVIHSPFVERESKVFSKFTNVICDLQISLNSILLYKFGNDSPIWKEVISMYCTLRTLIFKYIEP